VIRVAMAKSSKAKKEKKQDFRKPKLKVGKTKAKAANFTDTSFKAKCKSKP
jgi:pre-rRNA-processing protein IPI1